MKTSWIQRFQLFVLIPDWPYDDQRKVDCDNRMITERAVSKSVIISWLEPRELAQLGSNFAATFALLWIQTVNTNTTPNSNFPNFRNWRGLCRFYCCPLSRTIISGLSLTFIKRFDHSQRKLTERVIQLEPSTWILIDLHQLPACSFLLIVLNCGGFCGVRTRDRKGSEVGVMHMRDATKIELLLLALECMHHWFNLDYCISSSGDSTILVLEFGDFHLCHAKPTQCDSSKFLFSLVNYY